MNHFFFVVFFVTMFPLQVSVLSILLGLSTACILPLPSSKHTFDVPAWLSANFSCTGSPHAWEVRSSPGKGMGVFATRTLGPGDFILQEPPALRMTPPRFDETVGYNLTHIGHLLRSLFEALPAGDQAAVMGLHAHRMPIDERLDVLVSIFRTNAYLIGPNNTDMALFPKGARINHSCRPNTSHFWSEKLNKRTVYVTKRIEPGEEITATYVHLLQSHDDRQKDLEQYGFTCSCEVCAQERAIQEASDKRRDDIRKAFIAFASQLSLTVPKTASGRKKAQKNAHASVQLANLVEEEGLADFFPQAYRIAAISHARIEDWKPATIWAHKSYELWSMSDATSPASREMYALTSQFISNWNDDLRNKSMGRV